MSSVLNRGQFVHANIDTVQGDHSFLTDHQYTLQYVYYRIFVHLGIYVVN